MTPNRHRTPELPVQIKSGLDPDALSSEALASLKMLLFGESPRQEDIVFQRAIRIPGKIHLHFKSRQSWKRDWNCEGAVLRRATCPVIFCSQRLLGLLLPPGWVFLLAGWRGRPHKKVFLLAWWTGLNSWALYRWHNWEHLIGCTRGGCLGCFHCFRCWSGNIPVSPGIRREQIPVFIGGAVLQED